MASEMACRTPPGVRGLKSGSGKTTLLAREGRTPPGVRGLKYKAVAGTALLTGRTPPGVRGLKSLALTIATMAIVVAPHPGCVD